MKTFKVLMFVWLQATLLFAEDSSETEVVNKNTSNLNNSKSHFYIEKGLVDKVYDQTMSLEAKRHNSFGSMFPSIGILNAQEFELSNDYFAINYANQLGSIPLIGFALASEFARFYSVGLNFKGEFGYSYKQGTFKAKSASGSEINDTITLQWVPLMVGLSADYTPSWASWLKPSIEILGGAHWLHHSGTLDGLDHSVWVPAYSGGLSFAFFPSMKTGMGGISIGANYLNSSNSDQKIRGWVYKVGSSILL